MARRPRPEPRTLEVLKSWRLTENMHRVALGGAGLDGFPPDRDGGYIKLRLEDADAPKPVTRTYTIREQTADALIVDFALHGDKKTSGPATDWALQAEVGDEILVGGPGPAKPLPEGTGPFLLVGDMTALPAISVNLEDLPEDATGDAVLLIRSEDDIQDLDTPDGFTLHWVIDPELGRDPTVLLGVVEQLPDVSDVAYAWVACEFEAMKHLRTLLRGEFGFDKHRLYISSYWKRGLVEDEHKRVKRDDAG